MKKHEAERLAQQEQAELDKLQAAREAQATVAATDTASSAVEPSQNAQATEASTVVSGAEPEAINLTPATDSSASPSVSQSQSELESKLKAALARFETLEGKYKAEVPRLNEEKRELETKIAELSEKLESLTREPPKPSKPAWQRELSDEEAAEFTDEKEALGISGRAIKGILDETNQKTKEEMLRRINAIETQLKAGRAEIHKQAEQERMRDFFARVEKQAPGASKLDDDDRFQAFLDTADEESGRTWRELGESSVRAGDVRRTAEIYNTFKRVANIHDETVGGVDLVEGQIRPANVRASSASQLKAPQPKQSVRASEMKTFYGNAIRRFGNNYINNPAYQKQNKEYELAMAEGRVIVDG